MLATPTQPPITAWSEPTSRGVLIRNDAEGREVMAAIFPRSPFKARPVLPPVADQLAGFAASMAEQRAMEESYWSMLRRAVVAGARG